MGNSQECSTEFYFYCLDLKIKRQIANLFRFKSMSNGLPDHNSLEIYYENFGKKLKKYDPELKVDFDFFANVIFGAGTPPIVTCPHNSPAHVYILHGGEFGLNVKRLVEFVSALDSKLEVVASACDANTESELWLYLKSLSGCAIETREFEISVGHATPQQLNTALENIAWLKEGLSSVHEDFIWYQNKYFPSRVEKVTSRRGMSQIAVCENYREEVFNLLKSYGLLSYAEPSGDGSDDSAADFLEIVLQEQVSDRVIHYPVVGGGWVQGKLVDEYASLITKFCDKTKILIENLTLTPPLNEIGEEDSMEEMSISFSYKGKPWSCDFSIDTESAYFDKFSKWAKSVLKGGYLWYTTDYYRGYLLPKELIQNLKILGIYGDT
jgi:hypothetical protein